MIDSLSTGMCVPEASSRKGEFSRMDRRIGKTLSTTPAGAMAPGTAEMESNFFAGLSTGPVPDQREYTKLERSDVEQANKAADQRRADFGPRNNGDDGDDSDERKWSSLNTDNGESVNEGEQAEGIS